MSAEQRTRQNQPMPILEHVILPVIPARAADFELAFDEAKHIIERMPGFEHLTLARGIENPATYLLLVGWRAIEDHDPGFRGSPEYQQWRALLHHFYDPFPVVEHFTPVAEAGAA